MNELLISLVLSWIAGCFAELVSLIDFNSFPVMNENKFNEFGNPAIRYQFIQPIAEFITIHSAIWFHSFLCLGPIWLS